MMSYKRRLLIKLYDKGKGLATVTDDLVFKKLLTDTPSFLRFLVQNALSLHGDILKLEIINPEMVSIKRKTFILDLLIKLTIQAADDQSIQRHVVNIEMASSADKDTLSKCVAYGSRVQSQQIPKGSPYHLMPKVHCLAIIKTKAVEFNDTELYHHYHTYHNASDPASQTRIPGVRHAFLELGKFKKTFEELTTPLEKICYFLKKTDKMNMPLAEVVAYSHAGGPMGIALEQAMNKVIDYSSTGWHQDLRRQIDDLKAHLRDTEDERVEERVKELTEAIKEDATMRGKAEGRAEGKAEGRAKGRAEGRAEGKAEGKEIAQKEMAQKLMLRGFEHNEIAQLTGLTTAEIKTIRSAHESDHS